MPERVEDAWGGPASRAIRRSRALRLSSTYHSVGVIERQIELTTLLVAAAQARYAAAMGSQTKVLRAESELARLEATRRALDGRIEGADVGRVSGEDVPDVVHLAHALRDVRGDLRQAGRRSEEIGIELAVTRP